MYLIESYYSSPIAITYPKPVGYVLTLKEAKKICEEKNKKAVRYHYGYTKIKNLKPDLTIWEIKNEICTS